MSVTLLNKPQKPECDVTQPSSSIAVIMFFFQGNLLNRAKKSIVSWYPGYQPISNFADKFGLGINPSQPPLRVNSQIAGWTYDRTSHKIIVKCQSMAELIQASITRNKKIIKS